MLTIYVDADACPVKEEVYRVARRYGMRVAVVANAPLRVPADPLVEMVVRRGFGAADDWIAGQAGAGGGVLWTPRRHSARGTYFCRCSVCASITPSVAALVTALTPGWTFSPM